MSACYTAITASPTRTHRNGRGERHFGDRQPDLVPLHDIYVFLPIRGSEGSEEHVTGMPLGQLVKVQQLNSISLSPGPQGGWALYSPLLGPLWPVR